MERWVALRWACLPVMRVEMQLSDFDWEPQTSRTGTGSSTCVENPPSKQVDA